MVRLGSVAVDSSAAGLPAKRRPALVADWLQCRRDAGCVIFLHVTKKNPELWEFKRFSNFGCVHHQF